MSSAAGRGRSGRTRRDAREAETGAERQALRGGPSGPRRVRPPLPQEPLEVPRDRVAAREVLGAHARLLLLGGLLEALDEGLDVGVALNGEGDLALVVGGGRLELAGVDGDADQALELADQGEGGLRVGRGGDVVRDRGPQRGGRDAGLLAG